MTATRRRTRPGRLARLDAWLVEHERDLLSSGRGVVVDLGIGGVPHTTVELADALAVLDRPPAVVGVDHDPDLVERAAAFARPGLSFAVGGFELPVGPAVLVRAMNVLRDYGPADVAPAHEAMGAALCEGGLLVEGTSGPRGEVLCAWLVRRRAGALVREGLLFSTDFSRGFAPLLFRDRLPRDLRGAVKPGTPIHAFLADWTAAVDATGARTARERFVVGARALAARRGDVRAGEDWLVWVDAG